MTTKTIKKSEFYKNKKAFQIDDVDVNKILVSKKEPYGTKNALKYFTGYNEMMILGRYVYNFHKWQVMLKKIMKMQQCF